MAIVAIRKAVPTRKPPVQCNQKAIDALLFGSGDWSIEGEHGLFVRCKAQTKSFRLERRINGELVKQTLCATTMKEAKKEARETWSGMSVKPAGGAVTLGMVIEPYLKRIRKKGQLAETTKANYRYNAERYLADWTGRSLRDIGADRAGVRALQSHITKKYGPATANQVMRLLSSIYRWARKEDTSLPEPPTTAVEVESIPARNWALSPDELRTWWYASAEKDGKAEKTGVKALGPIPKMWWITTLLTGARAGSICWVRWSDIDFDKNVITFQIAKGNRPYRVPMSDKLAELLTAYRDSGNVPPSEWVFPSNTKSGHHLGRVRNRDGVDRPHALRHTFRTVLAKLNAREDRARLLMGHSMTGNVSRNYISIDEVTESLRPITNSVTESYLKILPEIGL